MRLLTLLELNFIFDKHNSFNIHFEELPSVKSIQAFTGSIAGFGCYPWMMLISMKVL